MRLQKKTIFALALSSGTLAFATLAAGYVCLGVPEAHSSTPAVEQYVVSQAPEELANKVCTAAGCAIKCGSGTCMSFRQNSTGGCTYTCMALIDKSKTPAGTK